MKIGMHAFLALASMALSSTVSLAAPSAPSVLAPGVGGKPPEKGGAPAPNAKSFVIRCPATTDDGSGLPALTITPIDLPGSWRVGSTTAIRLMSATVADGKITCAYGELTGAPAIRTSKALPAGVRSCTPQPDKTVSCVY
jgi:hypothetical protein